MIIIGEDVTHTYHLCMYTYIEIKHLIILLSIHFDKNVKVSTQLTHLKEKCGSIYQNVKDPSTGPCDETNNYTYA